MKAFHLVGPAPFYTNSFRLISDAGNAVVIDPAAEVQEYDKILKEHGGKLSLILCTHGHYDHVGSAGVLSREWGAKLYCEPADCRGTQLLPLKGSDSGDEEGEVIPLDELSFTVWHTPGQGNRQTRNLPQPALLLWHVDHHCHTRQPLGIEYPQL